MDFSAKIGFIFASLVIVACYIKFTRTNHVLPPGPRGNFFSGVRSLLPTTEPWKTYAEWSKQFENPVISFRVYNRIIIVLNDVKSIHTLLDQRAHIYSDRPFSWMFNVICGRGKAIFNISSLDPRHRIYRRLLQAGLGERATKEHWQTMRDETKILLEGFMSSPADWQQHIRRNAAAVIMKLAFGYTIESLDDPFIKVAEESSKISGWATAPGRWQVDYYPILRFIPSFFPGAQWKRQGLIWRERLRYLSEVPHNWVKGQMAKKHYEESFTSRLLRPGDGIGGAKPISAEEEDIIKWCAGGLYAGAADTTVSALISFVMLMALHPEVQQKAQHELDSVFNQDALSGFIEAPDPVQLSRLEYLTAIMQEVLRYAPVGNLALPHCLVEDDEYMGYWLPKGATVMANVWAVMHDHDVYPDPFVFSPERFVQVTSTSNDAVKSETKQPDPRQFAFGFGRRACPGTHFAETATLLNMAGILARFQIDILPSSSYDGGEGQIYPDTIEFTTGITSHVKPFPIRISPRRLPQRS
ncbi:cytochrome P450 [Flammula alnicola]|nr:cytochrome P450 [Flammula alnicola]